MCFCRSRRFSITRTPHSASPPSKALAIHDLGATRSYLWRILSFRSTIGEPFETIQYMASEAQVALLQGRRLFAILDASPDSQLSFGLAHTVGIHCRHLSALSGQPSLVDTGSRLESTISTRVCVGPIIRGRPRSNPLAEPGRHALFRDSHRHDIHPHLCGSYSDCVASLDG